MEQKEEKEASVPKIEIEVEGEQQLKKQKSRKAKPPKEVKTRPVIPPSTNLRKQIKELDRDTNDPNNLYGRFKKIRKSVHRWEITILHFLVRKKNI